LQFVFCIIRDMTVNVILQDIKKLESEALIVGFFEESRPLKGLAGELDWLLCGALSGLVLENKIHGSLGDIALLTPRGKVPAKKIFMVGLGPKAAFSPATVRSAARAAASSACNAGVTRAAIEYFPSSDAPYESSVAALSEGLAQGADGRGFEVSLLAPDAAAYEKIARSMKQ
jgi:leucyl aminopeptidase